MNLQELINQLTELRVKQANLKNQFEKSTDAVEVRKLGDDLEQVGESIKKVEAEIAKLNVEGRKFNPFGGMKGEAEKGDTSSLEYRNKFKEAIETLNLRVLEKRADQITYTSDASIVIPENLVNDIIEKIETYGTIYAKVVKTNFNVGETIPVGMIDVVATWVGTSENPTGEGLGSEVQKSGVQASVRFSNHKLRCVVGLTHEARVQTLEVFERKFVEKVAKAMVKAIEAAIINGDGVNKPKGILLETPEEGQAVKLAGDEVTYADVLDFISSINDDYNNGTIYMNKKTFYNQILGLVDSVGQPIARVNAGIDGKPVYTILGYPVEFNNKYLPAYASAEAGKVFAFFYDFSEYKVNTIYDLGISERTVWDNENHEIKAVLSLDGKAVTKFSLVTWSKKSA